MWPFTLQKNSVKYTHIRKQRGMIKMKTFDKANLKQVREDLNTALEAVAKKHGIQLSLGAITFSPESFSAKLTAVIPSDGAEAGAQSGQATKWAANFKTHARAFGMKPEDLGKVIKIRGADHSIVGMRPKAKSPLVLKKPDGAFIAYDVEPLIALLNNK